MLHWILGFVLTAVVSVSAGDGLLKIVSMDEKNTGAIADNSLCNDEYGIRNGKDVSVTLDSIRVTMMTPGLESVWAVALESNYMGRNFEKALAIKSPRTVIGTYPYMANFGEIESGGIADFGVVIWNGTRILFDDYFESFQNLQEDSISNLSDLNAIRNDTLVSIVLDFFTHDNESAAVQMLGFRCRAPFRTHLGYVGLQPKGQSSLRIRPTASGWLAPAGQWQLYSLSGQLLPLEVSSQGGELLLTAPGAPSGPAILRDARQGSFTVMVR
jgi:hypothetical protein